MEKSTAEVIVKVISILGFIGSGIGIIAGLLLIIAKEFILGVVSKIVGPALITTVGTFIIVFGVSILIFALLGIFFYYKLLNHANWARILIGIFSIFAIVIDLFSLPLGIIGILVNGTIMYFLLINKDIIALFKTGQ